MKKISYLILFSIIIIASYFGFHKWQELKEDNTWSELYNRAYETLIQKTEDYKLEDVRLEQSTYSRNSVREFHMYDLYCSNLDKVFTDTKKISNMRRDLYTRISYEGKECIIWIRKIICGEDTYAFYETTLYKNDERIELVTTAAKKETTAIPSDNYSHNKKHGTNKNTGSYPSSHKPYEDADEYAEDNWDEYSDNYDEGYEDAYDDWD